MEMHHVKYFLALCDEQNFTRAAKRCQVSQPSLTNAIKALEKEMGGVLFSRSSKTSLTDLGSAIRPYLEEIVLNVGTGAQLCSKPKWPVAHLIAKALTGLKAILAKPELHRERHLLLAQADLRRR